MARRGNRRTSSIGSIIGVAVVTALVAVSATLLATGGRAGGVAGVAADVSGAIGGVVSVPVRWVNNGMSSISSFFGGSSLNSQLKAENASLREWRDQAKAMAERLDAYEKLHNIAGEQLPQGLTGRLIGETSSTFSRTGIVNLGTKAGVQVNWVVINQNGLVGRVLAVGQDTSRVLLLGDGDSRVPVMGEISRARAIANGDKSEAPRLAHLNTPPLMRNGERVLTSGDDGLFPRGIAVGEAGIAPDKQWRVRLASAAAPIDFVRLVPPSNFPPPLDPVTPPPLNAPPTGASPLTTGEAGLGAVLPLAPNAAQVPIAATPEAIRAAQAELTRKNAAKSAQVEALNKKLIAERDAARQAAARAEAARLAAERRATSPTRPKSETSQKKLDPSSVPVAPSALTTKAAEPKAPDAPPIVEGPNK